MTIRKIILLLILFASIASCSVTPKDEALEGAPAHHTSRGFKNLYVKDPKKNFFSFLWMRTFGGYEWANHSATAGNVPFQPLDLARIIAPGTAPQISWLGHSTFLLQVGGINILTDPIFSDRASPFSFAGPKRYTPHTVDYTKLPLIDYVVISHNHYDHLNSTAVRVLGSNPVYLVPLGLKDWLISEGVAPINVVELDWWQKPDPVFTPGVTFEAQPSQHWSGRGLYDRRKTLWASWHIEIGGFTAWFAGDTGYNDVQFKEIGDKNGPVDLALIPIGAYAPRDFMQTYHVNPEEAVMIHQDIGAKRSIGMHWGTYPLTAEEPMDPIKKLAEATEFEGLSPDSFITVKLGETIRLNE